MELTLLGQAGVLVRLENGRTIAVDPYCSDSLRESKGERFRRKVPAHALACPDVLALTHDHGDHMDFGTIAPWLSEAERLPVLGTYPVYQAIASRWPARHNVMVMRPGVEVSLYGARLCAVTASHETPDAVGYLLHAEGKTVYFTGDTLFTRRIPEQLHGVPIDLMLVCINGFGNNMNAEDAARLTALLQPKLVVPVHWDMFEAFGADPQIFLHALAQTQSARLVRAYETIHL